MQFYPLTSHDYAGTGSTRCMSPRIIRPQLARLLGSEVKYEVFTGKEYRHSVTGQLHDVSWTETRLEDVVCGMETTRVRCRICPNCVALNSFIWAQASCSHHDEVMDEGGATLAVTLTFRDAKFREWWGEYHERRALDCEAFDDFESAEAIRRMRPPHKFFSDNRDHIKIALFGLGRDLTLYNKRLYSHIRRKPGILPMIVGWMGAFEFGTKLGRPHLHLLYHLKGDVSKVRLFRRHASRDWNRYVGFTKVKRVNTYGGCSYASKYIGKSYDATYEAFFERLRERPIGRYKVPIMTEQDSVEFAQLLGTLKLQRCRTRSSLGYRSRGVPSHEVKDDGLRASVFSDYQRSEAFCSTCGALDGCECTWTKPDMGGTRSGISPGCLDPPF